LCPAVERLAEKVLGRLEGGEQSVFVFVEDFLAGAADSVRFPVRVLFDMLEGDRLLPDGSLASANYEAERGGSDRISVALLRKVIRDRCLEDRLSVVMYDGYDVRLERTGGIGSFIMDPETDLRLGSRAVYPLEDLFLAHWWTVLEDGDDEEYFPFRHLLSKLADDVDDMAALVEGYAETGGLDRKVFEDLSTWVGSRKRGREFQVRYHGDWDVRTHRLDRATGGAATAATSTGTPKKAAEPKPKPKPKPAVKSPQVDSEDVIHDYLLIVDRVIHWGWRRLGLEVEDDTDAETVRRGLEAAIAKSGEQRRLSVKVESPESVVLILKGGHRDAYDISHKRKLGRYNDPIRDFIFSDDDEAPLDADGELSPEELKDQLVAAIKAMDIVDMVEVSVGGNRAWLKRIWTSPEVKPPAKTRKSVVSKPAKSTGPGNAKSKRPTAPKSAPVTPPSPSATASAVASGGDDVDADSRTLIIRAFIGSGMKQWTLNNDAPDKLAALELAVQQLGYGRLVGIRPAQQEIYLDLLATDAELQRRYEPLQQSLQLLDQIAKNGKEREHIELGPVSDEEWQRVVAAFRLVCRETQWCRDWRISPSSNSFGKGLLVERTSWAKRTLDRVLEKVDPDAANGAEITITDHTEPADTLARKLGGEIQRRGFRNVIFVSHGDSTVDLEYAAGNLGVLMGEDMDDLEGEKELLQDFLESGEKRRTVPAGDTMVEAKRKMIRIAGAAAGTDMLNRVEILAEKGKCVLSLRSPVGT